MKDIAIYGSGGFGREVACLIRMINESKKVPVWNLIGFFDDDSSLHGKQNEYGTVIGGIEELNAWNHSIEIVIAVGTSNAIKAIVEKISNPLVEFPNIIAPSVVFLDKKHVKMGKGNIISTNCTVSCHVSMGDFNLFLGCIPIGHDVEIGNYNVIMPSSNISGGVKMGDCNFMGTQSVVLQYLKIGNHVRIGANSVITRNTKDRLLYMGNPAKKIEL